MNEHHVSAVSCICLTVGVLGWLLLGYVFERHCKVPDPTNTRTVLSHMER